MNRYHRICLFGSLLLAGWFWSLPAFQAQEKDSIEFNRDVRPILSNTCFQCHGPDKAKRKAGLRFDTEDGARVDLGGYHAIVPGKPDESAMIQRVSAKDPAKRMPPATSAHPPLNAGQIDILRRWIAAGAKWQKHWAFIPPQKAALPGVKNQAWPRNAIDHFILAKLDQEGMTPSSEADRVTLIRRVALDLTGLPPTPAEVDAFLADRSADAYEKVVERLLQSPRYGERMAQRWLDAARYADTNGYQTDGDRIMWRWRDWVIDAYSANMPFDQFTIEQLAGDMLPTPTLEQRIATGFNRNHRGNSEGGVIPEEYAVEYVVDRVDTTATVWLGLTAGCAKCHSHKYDPITQKEFYQLFAYFNNVPEKGKAIKYGNSPPYIKTPTREQMVRRKLLHSQLLAAEQRWQELQPSLARAQESWEGILTRTQGLLDWTFTRGMAHRFSAQEKRHAGAGHFGFFDRFSMGAWVVPAQGKSGAILSRKTPEERGEGYNLALIDGKVHVELVKRWLDDAIRIETETTLPAGEKVHVFFTYDGSRLADGVRIYLNGQPARLKINLDDLNQSFKVDNAFLIGSGDPGIADAAPLEDVRIYDHAVAAEDVALIASRESVQQIVAIAPARRSPAQGHQMRSFFLESNAPASFQESFAKLRQARQELADFDDRVPTTMIMEEMPTPRDTHILIRGEYDKHGPKVSSGIPSFLPPLPKEFPNNRLGFARWLVHRDNPLTARVTVNRTWQMLFGAGLVKSVEDFGAQGEWPSHPELLDWLAVEFMEEGWDLKKLIKTIVTSATYRQSSKVTKDALGRDPDNRLLGRGPRFRLSADMVRDQALYVSGLLVERIGGPSVKPYQPAGLEKELNGSEDESHDHGPNLYRRSLYTYWKRTVAPPGLMTFDAANRETCVVRETRTNTPLQALNLLNDVTYVEAARVLAARVMVEAGLKTRDRLTLAFRIVTCRTPSERELLFLESGYDQHLANYSKNRDQALKLVSAGESPRRADLDLAEHAALSSTMNLILNLDEVITKE